MSKTNTNQNLPAIGLRKMRQKRPLLLIRPAVLPGESWGGYLLRLAESNRLPGIEALADLLGLSWQQLLVEEPADLLPDLSVNVPADYIQPCVPAQPNRQRVSLATGGRTRRSRVCPACLANDAVPYLRAEWEMPVSVECREHAELLQDACGQCGSALDILRPSVMQCRCGFSLATSRRHFPPAWARQVAKLFCEGIQQTESSTFARSSDIGRAAARVCHWLAHPKDPSTGSRPGRVIDREGFLDSRDLLALGPLLHDWPSRAAVAIAGECQSQPGNGNGVTALSERLAADRFLSMQELIQAAKSVVPNNLAPAIIHKRAQRSSVLSRKRGIKSLMKLTGHSYTALVEMIDGGRLPGASYTTCPQTAQRKFIIPSDLYDALASELRATSNVTEAAGQVGCTEDAIRGLTRSGCLPHASLLKSRRLYRLRPTDLVAMASGLFRLAKFDLRVPSLERVYFSSWAGGPYRPHRAVRWRVVLEAIRSGRLRLFKAIELPVQLDDLFLRAADLRLVLTAYQTKADGQARSAANGNYQAAA